VSAAAAHNALLLRTRKNYNTMSSSSEMPRAPGPDTDAIAEAVVLKLDKRLAELAQRRYLTVAHAAAYTDLSADTIRQLISGGRLTGLRPVPGRVLIDRRELDALLASSTRVPRTGRGRYDRAAVNNDMDSQDDAGQGAAKAG
jgi:excisionase family DNA binding protein